MNINERIKWYRESQGLKQNHVEAAAGLKPRRLSALENGLVKLTADEFERICIYGLKVNPSIFFADPFLKTKNSHLIGDQSLKKTG